MSKKQFRCAVSEDTIRHMPYVIVEHNQRLYKIDEVVELLNSLSEENVFLRFEVDHYKHQCKKLLEFQEWCEK